MWPLKGDSGELTGVGLAAFDSTEQYLAQQRLALLNEAAAGIGTTLDVVRTAEELVELLVPRYADFASVDLLPWVLGADEPPQDLDGDVVLRARRARLRHRGHAGGCRTARRDGPLPAVLTAHACPARGAGGAQPGRRTRLRPLGRGPQRPLPEGRSHRKGVHSVVAVPLRARGTTLGVAVGVRMAHPDDYAADDALFAEELASRAAVCIDNARRFARERSTALALQHSLLPRDLPGQAAVEVAHRYLPSGSLAGIGGDWFDVIPLSGSRVGLVVGDVVGHGIASSATMGRLCTAVRTLADVDLPPDELLTHLDDLVTHLATDDTADEVAELGATCLYAVYDPVSRHLTMAAAGHPPPAIVLPDGTASLVPITAGPPLGVGGLPFESVELELPEGATIALYTDGLIEDRERDLDHATDALCRALLTPVESLDALCDAVLKAVMPTEPSDDVALLLVRTRALGGDRVATWDIEADPAHVAGARQAATEQLTAWGAGRGGLRHRTRRQRTRHQRHPLRRTAHPAPPDPRPRPHLRGLRRQFHLTAPAPRPRLRRGRTRTPPRRPAPSAGAAGRPAAARPSGRNSRSRHRTDRRAYWKGHPGFGASSENGDPCGRTYSTSRTTGVFPRLRPMCTLPEPAGSWMGLPARYTPSEAQLELKWLSVPCLTTPYSGPSW